MLEPDPHHIEKSDPDSHRAKIRTRILITQQLAVAYCGAVLITVLLLLVLYLVGGQLLLELEDVLWSSPNHCPPAGPVSGGRPAAPGAGGRAVEQS